MTGQWLTKVAKLLECHQFEPLLACFLETLTDELSLDNYLFLAPAIDGRELKLLACRGLVVSENVVDDFSVNDFRHPFSHVLQSGQLLVLTQEKLAYWRDHSRFVCVADQVATEQVLLLFPLCSDNQVCAILSLKINNAEVETLLQRQDWQDYSAVFVRHWMMLKRMSAQSSCQTELSESIASMKEAQQQAEALEILSTRLVGSSAPMQKLRREILRGAGSQLSIMVQGETGTGKELVARAIHDFSDRHDKPFVAINCAAIPENLLESELFGYSKGAFSGADRNKKGLIAQADQGTLFLDEIGDMPLNLQSKLLRVLETGHYRTLGGIQENHADFRLVAATHVNLKEQIQNGGFRRDLYYRLCQFPLTLPPLRERENDIPELVQSFIRLFNESQQRQIPGIRFNAISQLQRHNFPGNVRELRNMLEYACALTADATEIDAASLPALEVAQPDSVSTNGVGDGFDAISDLRQAVAQFELAVIRSRLQTFNGDRTKAAMSLGLPKRTFSHKCQKLEITE